MKGNFSDKLEFAVTQITCEPLWGPGKFDVRWRAWLPSSLRHPTQALKLPCQVKQSCLTRPPISRRLVAYQRRGMGSASRAASPLFSRNCHARQWLESCAYVRCV